MIGGRTASNGFIALTSINIKEIIQIHTITQSSVPSTSLYLLNRELTWIFEVSQTWQPSSVENVSNGFLDPGPSPDRCLSAVADRNSESPYSERSLFRRSLFRKVAIPKGRYSEGRYSERSLFRKSLYRKITIRMFSNLTKRRLGRNNID